MLSSGVRPEQSFYDSVKKQETRKNKYVSSESGGYPNGGDAASFK